MIARIQDFLASKGRVMVGWDEILHNELHSETLVMSYRGQKGAIEAANRGNYAVMTPGEVLYFDWYQADPSTQPRAMYGYSPIKKMYAFEPVPADPGIGGPQRVDHPGRIRGPCGRGADPGGSRRPHRRCAGMYVG